MDNVNRDYYQVLGLPRDATQSEIDEACIRLAEKYRPERNPDDLLATKNFALIEEVYETLGNPAKRAAYDISLRSPHVVAALPNIKTADVSAAGTGFVNRRATRVVAVIVSVLILFSALGYAFLYRPYAVGKAAEELGGKKTNVVIEFLTGEVKNKLKDPESALFKDVQLYSSVILRQDRTRIPITYTLCGRVNAKNAMGGYVGYRGFYAETSFVGEGWVYVWIYDGESEQQQRFFAKTIEEKCKDEVKPGPNP